jgi:hypothetical protein
MFPVAYDFNRDGIDDLGVYRRGHGMPDSYWWVYFMPNGGTSATNWGSASSLPVPGYYRAVTDALRCLASYHLPITPVVEWNIPYRPNVYLGAYGETLAVPACDFDGNGFDDICVYNYKTGNWSISLTYANQYSGITPAVTINWGFPGAIPANIYTTMYNLGGFFYYTRF